VVQFWIYIPKNWVVAGDEEVRIRIDQKPIPTEQKVGDLIRDAHDRKTALLTDLHPKPVFVMPKIE